MDIRALHAWPEDVAHARVIQEKLRVQVKPERLRSLPQTIAGAVVDSNSSDDRVYASVVVVDANSFGVLETVTHVEAARFPYLPGLLSFRELPVLLGAFQKLKTAPEAVIINRHGDAHPLRVGMASHLGVWLQIPTVGCLSALLTGTPQSVPRDQGGMAPILDETNGEVIGLSVRTRAGAHPVFVSSGHLITLSESGALVVAQSIGRRIPMALRLAQMQALKLRNAVKTLDPETAALLKGSR